MILEIAHIDIKPDAEDAFEAAVTEALPLFLSAQGCQGVKLHRGVERPSHYVLMVQWDTLDDHIVAFAKSPAFARWRELVGPHFAGPPQMEHVQSVLAT